VPTSLLPLRVLLDEAPRRVRVKSFRENVSIGVRDFSGRCGGSRAGAKSMKERMRSQRWSRYVAPGISTLSLPACRSLHGWNTTGHRVAFTCGRCTEMPGKGTDSGVWVSRSAADSSLQRSRRLAFPASLGDPRIPVVLGRHFRWSCADRNGRRVASRSPRLRRSLSVLPAGQPVEGPFRCIETTRRTRYHRGRTRRTLECGSEAAAFKAQARLRTPNMGSRAAPRITGFATPRGVL